MDSPTKQISSYLAEPAKVLDDRAQFRAAWLRELKSGAHIHISGICGTGTSAVLLLLKDLGFRVTGSDKAFYPPMGDIVRNNADKVYEGYSANNLAERPDLVIIGNALSRGNPEIEHVLEAGIPFASMPEVFSALLIGSKDHCATSVVVCGTHGKTTTTAALALVLDNCGIKPGFFVGGVPQGLSRGIRLPSSEVPASQRVVVLEGDEYDSAFFAKFPKFHFYRPDICVITTLEFDHADIYQSVEEIEAEFSRLVERLPEGAKVILSSDEPRLLRLADLWRQSSTVKAEILSYGERENDTFRLLARKIVGEHQQLLVKLRSATLELETKLFGRHNAQNMLAVAAVCSLLGIEADILQEAFPTFSGVKRRQELLFESRGIRVIEDFAHHPTEVRETLRGLKERYPENRLIVAFEPRSNTSQRDFFQLAYLESFLEADCAYLMEVVQPGGFAGRAENASGLNVGKIVSELNEKKVQAKLLTDFEEMEELILQTLAPGDLLVLMSNGSFGGLAKKIPAQLKQISST